MQKELNKEEKKNKKQVNGCLVVFLIIAGVIVYIGASSLSGSDSKNAVKSKQEESEFVQVSQSKISQEQQIQKNEIEAKPDFKVTTDELYSMYVQANEDPSVWEKYDGKIVEITGMVEKAEDIVGVFKNSLGYSAWVERYGETIPSFIQSDISDGKRYYICLADKEGHGCVVWAYSNSPQLIKGVEKGERVTAVGQFKWYTSMSPDLMNSEVKKIY